jgi:hypothetical protein
MAQYAVRLGGVDLARMDAVSGASVVVEDVAGWIDMPEVRSSMSDRPGVNGSFDGHPLWSSRVVTLTGVISGRTQGDALATRNTIAGMLFSGDLQQLTIQHDELGELSAMVRPSAAPMFAHRGGSASLDFSITVTAPDPTLYGRDSFTSLTLPQFTAGGGWQWPMSWPVDWGTPDEGSASVFLPNDGTATYWPRLRLSGELVNPTLSLDTGEWLRFNGSLAADQWLDLDLPNRRVLLNGQASRRQFVTTSYGSSWLGVPAGGARLSWAADNTNDTARFSVWAYQGAWA